MYTGGFYAMDNFCPPFAPMVKIFKESDYRVAGKYKLSRFSINAGEARFMNMRSAYSFSDRGSHYEPGEYVKLSGLGGSPWMTDTYDERRTNMGLLRKAHGNVLVGGLGLGMVLIPLLQDIDVTSIAVVEKNEDVAELVWPRIHKWAYDNGYGHKIEFGYPIIADVLDKPGNEFKKMYDVVYMDIWSDISADDWEEMKKLRRIWKKTLKDGGWFGCWKESEIRYRATGRSR